MFMFAYYALYRPPGIGCQPACDSSRTHFDERCVVSIDLDEGVSFKTRAWGEVLYEEPLDPGAVGKFELMPTAPVEWAKYQFWLHANGVGEIWDQTTLFEQFVLDLTNEQLLTLLADARKTGGGNHKLLEAARLLRVWPSYEYGIMNKDAEFRGRTVKTSVCLGVRDYRDRKNPVTIKSPLGVSIPIVGKFTYSGEPLTHRTVRDWNVYPLNPVQWAEYQFWVYNDSVYPDRWTFNHQDNELYRRLVVELPDDDLADAVANPALLSQHLYVAAQVIRQEA